MGLRFAFLGGLIALTVASVGNPAFAGSVGRVIDGDDLCLCGDDAFVRRFAGHSKSCDRACARVRLCGIDAYELHAPGGRDARRRLAALTSGKNVTCTAVGDGTVCDGRSQRFNHDRVIAQCHADGRDIARDMVESGHACDWPRYSGGHYSRAGRACPDEHRKR